MYFVNYIRNHRRAPKKNRFKAIALFLAFQLMFACISLPILIFYGPFNNVKSTLVGASYRTLKHQFIAGLFLSEDEIRSILKDTEAKDPTLEGQEIKILKFGNRTEDKVEVYHVRGRDFNGKLMIVYDPTRIKAAYSPKMPLAGETTSAVAKRNGAIAAINAGGFMDSGWVGTGGTPMGFIIHEGNIVYNQYGSDEVGQDTVAFTREGMLIVGRHSIKKLKEYGVQEGVSFGPPLIVNGEPTIKNGDGGWGIAPRTAIGQRENGEVLLLTIDGRSLGTFGATLRDVQDILLRCGAVNAANLDGGSSTTMFFNGDVINVPSDRLGERAVPSIFMVVPPEGGSRK